MIHIISQLLCNNVVMRVKLVSSDGLFLGRWLRYSYVLQSLPQLR